MIEILARRKLIEIFELAAKGQDLGCTVKAVHLDSAANSIFIAFSEPYRISQKVYRTKDITDETVSYARLDLDRMGVLLAIEIFKNPV